ncbi:TlpA family protein disulfide reductase [Sphingobacterium sp. DN00404]|uniref:TlpA family protein disulfide reductase n=1 Tax=Sphingobacterium micropteri TaxID=2763501 RepID=A0ABR7YSN6_9SPHI|nr:TlpA disulfide reductase family protein [Sphingobacterium micropteri]MBD1434362.1 TlpA family protein disulfide reductase [Sphingobacterium micropteri]
MKMIPLITLLIPLLSYSQINLTDSNLKVGDTIPQGISSALFHPSDGEIDISSLDKKLVILDFWAAWCSPCVEALPKLDSIQREFGEHIQIIPITYQKATDIRAIVAKVFKNRETVLPMVIEDNTYRHLFPHRSLPHTVWLDREGRVLAITDGSEINGENIRLLLKARMRKGGQS